MKSSKALIQFEHTYSIYIKILVVIFVLCLTFLNMTSYVKFFDSQVVKSITLLFILFILYIDIHTGILLLIAFIIIIVQLNAMSVKNLNVKRLELFLSSIPSKIQVSEDPNEVYNDIVECDNEKKNKTNDDILAYSVDSKIRPYEVFVKMLTTQEHLDNASNSAFLT
jgi:hypothetical protein